MGTLDHLSGKRLLVTGGAGFIGSHLVNRLIRTGANVTVLLKSGEPLWRLTINAGQYDAVTADIADSSAISRLFTDMRPDGVFHLAAYGVDSAAQDVNTAIRVNVLGTVNVLNGMNASGCHRIVTMGSGAEYGNHEGLIREGAALFPGNVYASTKAAAALIAHQYAAEMGISIVTLRPFGVYGEAEPKHKLFCHAILTMLSGDDLDLTACTQKRDYCYVEDVVDALILSFTNTALTNDILNVGTGVALPLRYYIEHIRAQIKPSGRVRYGALPFRSNEVWSPIPDVSLIRQRLGWQNTYSLEDGLNKTIQWFREHRHYYEKN